MTATTSSIITIFSEEDTLAALEATSRV
ncbi:hypothetical protein QTG54_011373 [Skeletonema marinoi]|uniref:Uncharacterized protein n=1 Tax=Skeletonema marinoi TaxID=267567 RepID=A0AAD8Y2P3_9STRA|nr:hypothetical protein QTG54_011373 [Skeletonema marinoi]